MKKLIILALALAATYVLCACTRTHADGTTEEISGWEAAADILIGQPKKGESYVNYGPPASQSGQAPASIEDEEQSEGLLPILGILATVFGGGWARSLLTRKNILAVANAAIGAKNDLQRDKEILASGIEGMKKALEGDQPILDKAMAGFREGRKVVGALDHEVTRIKSTVAAVQAIHKAVKSKGAV